MRTEIDTELDMGRSMLGNLSESARARLRRYDFDPCASNWDDIAHLLIQPNMTVWQAWIQTDDMAVMTGPRTDATGRLIEGWKHWPDRAAFRRLLFFATH